MNEQQHLAYWRDRADNSGNGICIEDIITEGKVFFQHNDNLNETSRMEDEIRIYKKVVAKLSKIIKEYRENKELDY